MQRIQWRIVGLGDYHNYFSYFTYGILEGSIRCGAWFRPVPLFGISLEQVKAQVEWMKPHVLFSHMIFNTRPNNRDEVLSMMQGFKRSGITTIYHAGDARPEPRYPHDISDYISFALCNFGGSHLEKFSKIWNVPCYHWPYPCLYQKDIGPIDKVFEAEVAFTGTIGSLSSEGHHTDRTSFMNLLAARSSRASLLRMFPTPQTGNTRMKTAELAATSFSVLGYQMGLDIPLYVDVRPFQYIGAGALYFQDRHPNMDKFFQHGTHYVGFERGNVDDFLERYEFMKKAPSNVAFIRNHGFAYCQRWHSTEARVRFVLDLLEGKVDKPTIYLEDCK